VASPIPELPPITTARCPARGRSGEVSVVLEVPVVLEVLGVVLMAGLPLPERRGFW